MKKILLILLVTVSMSSLYATEFIDNGVQTFMNASSGMQIIVPYVPPAGPVDLGWTETNAPFALYHMESTNGSASTPDFSGNSLDGINNPSGALGVTFTNIGTRVIGGIETAALGDGINDFLNLGNSTNFNFIGAGNWSISLWLKADATLSAKESMLGNWWDGSVRGIRLEIEKSGTGLLPTLLFRHPGQGGDSSIAGAVSLETYTDWINLTLTHSGSDFVRYKFYWNAVLVTEDSYVFYPNTNTADMHLFDGGHGTSPNFQVFGGMLDDVGFYPVTLSSNAVHDIYINRGFTNHPTLSVEVREEL